VGKPRGIQEEIGENPETQESPNRKTLWAEKSDVSRKE